MAASSNAATSGGPWRAIITARNFAGAGRSLRSIRVSSSFSLPPASDPAPPLLPGPDHGPNGGIAELSDGECLVVPSRSVSRHETRRASKTMYQPFEEALPVGASCPPASPCAGQLLAGKYRLLRQVARGSMGAVWAAEHVVLRSPVAVKFMHEADSSDEPATPKQRADSMQRFLAEARIACAAKGPHVGQLRCRRRSWDSGSSDPLPAFCTRVRQVCMPAAELRLPVASNSSSQDSCDPPWIIDARGIRRVRRSCL
jgi:serine/threonine protein kinase